MPAGSLQDRQVICFVVADHVVEREKFSFKFMVESQMPLEFRPYGHIYGLVLLKKKPEDFLDLFKIGQSADVPQTKTGEFRWEINIFENGKGFIFGQGADDDVKHEEIRQTFMDEIPDSVILTDIETFQALKNALTGLDIEIREHRFNGILSTA